MAGLDVPVSTWEKAAIFLDSLQATGGMKDGETSVKDASDTATSMGLLARMYIGSKAGGVGVLGSRHIPLVYSTQSTRHELLNQRGPSEKDAVSNFHATMLMHSHAGISRATWHRKIRQRLGDTQAMAGDDAGSWWNPDDIHAAVGGRLLQTAINTMTLEVYYDYLLSQKSPPQDNK